MIGDDERQRPQDQREHPEHDDATGEGALARRRRYRLAKGVKRAGADVAEDDAERAERERQKAGLGGSAAGRLQSVLRHVTARWGGQCHRWAIGRMGRGS